MNVLAFTTSTDHGSIALAQNGKATAVTQWARNTQGSEILTYKIKLLLSRAKLAPTDLDVIAVDKGPGSFTGCRIAVNVAKTMAMTLQKPLVAEFSLDIMAQEALTELGEKFSGRIICLLDAHKSLFYSRWYECRHLKIMGHAPHVQALSLDSLEKLFMGHEHPVMIGYIPETFKNRILPLAPKVLKKIKNVPRAETLALMASSAQTIDWRALEPSYIRSPEAVEKLR